MALSGDPFTLLGALFVVSLFADSAATIVAALLVARGLLPMGLTAVALPVFLVVGDAALYLFGLLARENKLFERYTPTNRIAAATGWLTAHRTQVLALTRALPGSRSFVFVGFGYLRMPVIHFLVVNTVAATAWSLVLMAFVTTSASWFEDAGLMPSLAAGLIAAAIVLVPTYLLAARAKPPPTPKV